MNKLIKSVRQHSGKLALAASMGLASMSANAALDVTSITTATTEAAAAVAIVGAAVVVVKVGTKVYKWITSAL